MKNNSNLVNKTLVFGIMVLFIGVGVYPAIAVELISSTDTIQDNEIESLEDIEPKEYLFQTIIDIANNPDVKDLLEQIKDDWKNNNPINFNFDSKSMFRKLLFSKPSLIFPMLFAKPSITYDYFDKSYNRGIEITNILGEDEVIETVKSIEIINPRFFNELNNIIMNNEELYNRITTLTEMNDEINPTTPWEDYPIICNILVLILVPTYYALYFFEFLLSSLYNVNPILCLIFLPPFFTILILGLILSNLLFKFDCIYIP